MNHPFFRIFLSVFIVVSSFANSIVGFLSVTTTHSQQTDMVYNFETGEQRVPGLASAEYFEGGSESCTDPNTDDDTIGGFVPTGIQVDVTDQPDDEGYKYATVTCLGEGIPQEESYPYDEVYYQLIVVNPEGVETPLGRLSERYSDNRYYRTSVFEDIRISGGGVYNFMCKARIPGDEKPVCQVEDTIELECREAEITIDGPGNLTNGDTILFNEDGSFRDGERYASNPYDLEFILNGSYAGSNPRITVYAGTDNTGEVVTTISYPDITASAGRDYLRYTVKDFPNFLPSISREGLPEGSPYPEGTLYYAEITIDSAFGFCAIAPVGFITGFESFCKDVFVSPGSIQENSDDTVTVTCDGYAQDWDVVVVQTQNGITGGSPIFTLAESSGTYNEFEFSYSDFANSYSSASEGDYLIYCLDETQRDYIRYYSRDDIRGLCSSPFSITQAPESTCTATNVEVTTTNDGVSVTCDGNALSYTVSVLSGDTQISSGTYRPTLGPVEFALPDAGEYIVVCESEGFNIKTCPEQVVTIDDQPPVCVDLTEGSISFDIPSGSDVSIDTTTIAGDVIDGVTDIWITFGNNQRLDAVIDDNRWVIDNVPVGVGINEYRVFVKNECSIYEVPYVLDGVEEALPQFCKDINVDPVEITLGNNESFGVECIGSEGTTGPWSVLVLDEDNVEVFTELNPTQGTNQFTILGDNLSEGDYTFICQLETQTGSSSQSVSTALLTQSSQAQTYTQPVTKQQSNVNDYDSVRNNACALTVTVHPEEVECTELPGFRVRSVAVTDTTAVIEGDLFPVDGVQDIVVEVFEGTIPDPDFSVGLYSGSDIIYGLNEWSVVIENLDPQTQYYARIDAIGTDIYCSGGTDRGFETTAYVCEDVTVQDFEVTTPNQATLGSVTLQGVVSDSVDFLEVILVGQETAVFPVEIENGTWRTLSEVPVAPGTNTYRIIAKNECSSVSIEFVINGTYEVCEDDPSYAIQIDSVPGIQFLDGSNELGFGDTTSSANIVVQGVVRSGQDKQIIIKINDEIEIDTIVPSTQDSFAFPISLDLGLNTIQIDFITTNGGEVCALKEENFVLNYAPTQIACTGIDITPSIVVRDSGENFVVTCEGALVEQWIVQYESVNTQTQTIPTPDVGTNDQFTIKQSDIGVSNEDYEVTCIAVDSTTNTTPSYCTESIRVTEEVCIDDISYFNIQGATLEPIETSNTTEIIRGSVDVAATERVEWTIYENVEGGVFFKSGVADMDLETNTYSFTATIIPDPNIITYIRVEPVEKFEGCPGFIGNDILFVADKECTDQVGEVTITSSDIDYTNSIPTTDIVVTTELGFNKNIVLRRTNSEGTKVVGLHSSSMNTEFTFSDIELGEGINTFEVVITPLNSSGDEIEGCNGTVTKQLDVSYDTVCIEGIEVLTAEVIESTVTTQTVDVMIGTSYDGQKEIIVEVFTNGSSVAAYTTTIIRSGRDTVVNVPVGVGENIIKVTADINGCNTPKDTSVLVIREAVCPADYDFGFDVDTQSGIVNYDGTEVINGTANPSTVESVTVKVTRDNSGNDAFFTGTGIVNSDGAWSVEVPLLSGQDNYIWSIANGINPVCSQTKDIEIKQVNECIENEFGYITYNLEQYNSTNPTSKGTQELFVSIENIDAVLAVRANVDGNVVVLERTVGGFKGLVDLTLDQNTIEIGIRGVNPTCEVIQQITVYTEVVIQCDAPVNDVTVSTIQVSNGTATVPVTITNVQNNQNNGTKSVVYTLAKEGQAQAVDLQTIVTTESEIVFTTTNLSAGNYLVTVTAQRVQDNGSIIDACDSKGGQGKFEIEELNPVCEPTVVAPTTVVSNTDGKFEIVCEGNDDIIGFTVEYSVPQSDGSIGTGEITTTPVVSGNTQTFVYSETDVVGTYTFECVGWTLDPDPTKEEVQCGSGTGAVVHPTGGSCPDKFKVTSDELTLTATRIEGTATARITGSYDATNPIIAGVTYLGDDIETTLLSGVRTFSVIVDLEQGTNTYAFQLRSIAKNLDCAAQATIEITYSPTTGGQCPVDQQVSVSDLVVEAEVVSGVTSTTITGTYLLNGPVGSVLYNGQPIASGSLIFVDNSVIFTVPVTLADGNNEFVFTIVPKSSDTDCKPVVKTLTVVYPPEAVCEDIRNIQIIENTGSVANSVETYEFNGSYIDTGLESFVITKNGVQIDSSDISLSKVGTSSTTNFRTIVPLSEGRNEFTFTATSINSDAICNDSETIIITRNTRTNGGSGGGGRASSILCGNGRIDERRGVSEQCDDGNVRSGDGCSSTCQIEEEPVCGNGIIEIGEMCDDSNRVNGDGCNSICDIEDEEIKKEIVKEQIKETLRRRTTPLGYTPPTPPKVLPKTGNNGGMGAFFRNTL